MSTALLTKIKWINQFCHDLFGMSKLIRLITVNISNICVILHDTSSIRRQKYMFKADIFQLTVSWGLWHALVKLTQQLLPFLTFSQIILGRAATRLHSALISLRSRACYYRMKEHPVNNPRAQTTHQTDRNYFLSLICSWTTQRWSATDYIWASTCICWSPAQWKDCWLGNNHAVSHISMKLAVFNA